MPTNHDSTRIVLASNNAGKLNEMRILLQDFNADITPQAELGVSEAEETGLTFIENALIKARHAAHTTGLPAIADDSGLEVDALQGAPGIYSARFSGSNANDASNNQHLLDALKNVPTPERTARYHCILVYLRHAADPTPIISQGCWEGSILTTPRGDGGFGYDPLFFVASHQCTAAELRKGEKNRISHRAIAMAQLAKKLQR